MALPTTQTPTLIVTEALKEAGYGSPSSSQISHAEANYLRDAIKDLFIGEDWKILEFEYLAQLSNHEAIVDLPSACGRLLQCDLYYGDHYGTCQSSSQNSIVLKATEDITDDEANGKMIALLSGTAIGEWATITAYNETTKGLTPSPVFSTFSSETPSYLILTGKSKLHPMVRETWDPTQPIEPPTHYFQYRKARTDPVPSLHFNGFINSDDHQYIYWIRYILDLDKVDLTDTRMTRIYDKYRQQLIASVRAMIFDVNDDDRAVRAIQLSDRRNRRAYAENKRERLTRGNIGLNSPGGMPTRT